MPNVIPNEKTVYAIDAFGRLSVAHAVIAGVAILVAGAIYIWINFKKGQKEGPSQPNDAVVLAGQFMEKQQMALLIHEMHELTEALCSAVKQVNKRTLKVQAGSASAEATGGEDSAPAAMSLPRSRNPPAFRRRSRQNNSRICEFILLHRCGIILQTAT